MASCSSSNGGSSLDAATHQDVFSGDTGQHDLRIIDAGNDACSGNRCCALNKCRVDEAGTSACCFSENQPGYSICCNGVTHGVVTFACDPQGHNCMKFCDECVPYYWKGFKPDAFLISEK